MPTSQPPPRNILIIEDDVSVQQALTFVLEANNFKATVFNDAGACIDYLNHRATHIDQIQGAIIDYHLPDLNGIELATNLSDTLSSAAKIVLISGQSSDWLIKHHHQARLWPHLQKPFSIDQLLAELG